MTELYGSWEKSGMHNDQEAARCAILRTLVWITEGKEK
jgi:hypothetical protein